MSNLPRIKSRAAPRQDVRVPAAELACALRAVCELGLLRRRHGGCLGGVCVSGLAWTVEGPGILVARCVAPQRRHGAAPGIAAALRHLRRGHDAGCFAFGVPLAELGQLAQQWGGTDAAGYLMEGAGDAARMVNGDDGWSAERALELFDLALAAKITPAVPSPRMLAALARRPAAWRRFPRTRRAGTPRLVR